MANEQNLTQNQARTEHEKQELWRKAGRKSGEVRRKKSDFIKVAKALLNCEISNKERKKLEKKFKELSEEDINYRALILVKQLEKAIKGDTVSAKFLIDTTGEKPSDNMSAEPKLPVINIEIVDNKELEEEFEKYDEI